MIFIHDRICYTKYWGNKNSLDSLNVMVNYHYHGENRVITRYFSSMVVGTIVPYIMLLHSHKLLVLVNCN